MKVYICVALVSVVAADSSYGRGRSSASSAIHRRPRPSYGAPKVNTAFFSGPVRSNFATNYGPSHEDYDSAPKPYQFEYGVNDPKSGTVFSQREKSDGKTTRGYYSVNLPDGRIQHVDYKADDYNGYKADVTYTGKAQHPVRSGDYGYSGPSYYPDNDYRRPDSYQSDDDYKPYGRH